MAIIVALIVFAIILLEMRVSTRNERALRARGAIEPTGDVYRTMSWTYPASFASMAIEGVLRGAPPRPWIVAGLVVLALAKAIKYWAITTLGPHWSFRVLVVPGQRLVAEGPYRFVRHPNYIGVIGELLGVALLLGAVLTGTVATVGFAMLIRKRINVEERSLGIR